MAAYTETKTYHTKAHMGMIDVTEDFGGITVSFTNETKADLVLEVLTWRR